MDFGIPARSLREKERKQKYQQILRPCLRRKKPWNMRVIAISIIFGALGLVAHELEKGRKRWGIRERIETIYTSALLRSFKILSTVPETLVDFLSLRLLGKTIIKCWCEKLVRSYSVINESPNPGQKCWLCIN